jgi:hypothetical protein
VGTGAVWTKGGRCDAVTRGGLRQTFFLDLRALESRVRATRDSARMFAERLSSEGSLVMSCALTIGVFTQPGYIVLSVILSITKHSRVQPMQDLGASASDSLVFFAASRRQVVSPTVIAMWFRLADVHRRRLANLSTSQPVPFGGRDSSCCSFPDGWFKDAFASDISALGFR